MILFRRLLSSLLLIAALLLHSLCFAALHLGDSGPQVSQIQQILIARGYLSGTADGVYGSATFEAIKKFQAAQGLTVDGICGEATLNLLSDTLDTSLDSSDPSAYAIKLGMVGPDVEELQNVLIALGYMSGAADGVAGPATVAAITSFQSSHGLVPDGVCGSATFDAINAEAEEFMSSGSITPQGHVESFGEDYPEEIASGGYAEVGSVIKAGMHGEGVTYVQQKLIEHGFLTGHADGIAGDRTVAAIKRFQSSVGLPADGVCGLQTYAALEDIGYNITDTEWIDEVDEVPTLGRSVYVEATAYSPFDPGAGTHTARGNRVRRGIIAVDPRFIPLGTRVYIPGYGEAVADDTGGAIVGNRIDIAFDTYDEAMHFGRQRIEIYILDN